MLNKIGLLLIILIILISFKRIENFKSNSKKKKNNSVKLGKYELNKKQLKDKVIIITGSTKGIGFELAKTLNNFKSKLVINGRNKDNVDSIVKKFKKINDNVIGVDADISKESDVLKLFNTVVDKFGSIDILVNNATITLGHKDLSRKTYKDWKQEFSTNIDGVFLLSQKVIEYMRTNRINGRIINVSSESSKLTNTNMKSGTHILSKNFIEKMTNILADENYTFRIAVTTIRIDEFINTNFNNLIPLEIPKSLKKLSGQFKTLTSMFASDPSKIIPVFLYVMRAPFHEISGKLISTSSYLKNPKLSKIIPTYQLALDDKLFKNAKLTKSIDFRKNKGSAYTYLVKQNSLGPSERISEIIKKRKIKFNNINTNSKYKSVLDRIIGKHINVNHRKITFFRNEYEALRKIVELFVPNYQEVITIYPSWSYLFIVCNEKKITMKYTTLKDNGKGNIQPNFYFISRFINSRTKLIYLSSPNTTTGQSLTKSDFSYLLSRVPDNIPILIDQRYQDFSNNTDCLNPLNYLNRNIIILRSFNNFYSIENLELAYVISSLSIAKILQHSQIINNQLDRFTEDLAITVFNDKKYNRNIINYFNKEKLRIYKKLKKLNIKFIKSETNYILVETNRSREECKKDLEKNNIILYESDDSYGSYWTLPLASKRINNKVIDIISSYIV